MILELVILDVIPGRSSEFQTTFDSAQKLLVTQEGYISHQLQRSLEKDNRFVLLVNWTSLEAHMEGFRQSRDYQLWKQLLHGFYQSFPLVEHYELL